VQFFCIDFGGGALRAVEGLPHVSGVAVRMELEAVRRTVAEVSAILEQREARFAAEGIESIDAYRDRRHTASSPTTRSATCSSSSTATGCCASSRTTSTP
jgi:DNA segregation ATPase FtsK/SpoIIIE-like protein